MACHLVWYSLLQYSGRAKCIVASVNHSDDGGMHVSVYMYTAAGYSNKDVFM